jgi:hypothetical protein
MLTPLSTSFCKKFFFDPSAVVPLLERAIFFQAKHPYCLFFMPYFSGVEISFSPKSDETSD